MTLPQEMKELSSPWTAPLATPKAGDLLSLQTADENYVVMVLLSFVGVI